MFICDSCLNEKYTNGPTHFKSRGKCEMCDKSSICSDIPTKFLSRKKSFKECEFIQKKYEAEG